MGNLRNCEDTWWKPACGSACACSCTSFPSSSTRTIEIYKYGASAWPRAIILLIAIAAMGQLYHHWKYGDQATRRKCSGAASDDGAEEAAHEAHHENLKWYLSTFGCWRSRFIYMRLPDWIAGGLRAGAIGSAHRARDRRRDPVVASWCTSFAITACASR